MASAHREYRVLTAVGLDRPGLVERISTAIHSAGANLEDSRMAILGGEFALILLFSGQPDEVNQVEQNSAQWAESLGLSVSFKATGARPHVPDYRPYLLRVSGVDRPGIVAQVSSLLAGRKVNVAALDSRLSYAPLSGTPLFHLQARLQVPSETALATLRAELGKLSEEENLDVLLDGDGRD
jgi:glycine cleavage system transcriptional repressor